MITRYSSRRCDIHKDFLCENLKEANKYDRIAGYFSSSILELIYNQLDSIEGKTRIICNSSLSEEDVKTAQRAEKAMKKEWYENKPKKEDFKHQTSANKLYELLISEKIEIRVLPNEVMGLIHGKAGVITYNNGTKTAFIGSANETYNAFKHNYELIWTDVSQEGIEWVQEEFDSLWNHPSARDLSKEVINSLKRMGSESEISVSYWKEKPSVDNILIETPIDMNGGFWDHQKYFIQLAFNSHINNDGARFILADTVGLGKTIQLASVAKLIALYDNKPVLIIVPKTLMNQWQKEMKENLDIPSARWEGGKWIDENDDSYRKKITECPRKIGIISQGLITSDSEVVKPLLLKEYGCVIVDEAHRAGRSNLQDKNEGVKAKPNNLMKFLLDISLKTKSMFLATATPVQMNPIQAYDLLSILNEGDNRVLGRYDSKWRYEPKKGIDIIMNDKYIESMSFEETFSWMKNPFPYTFDKNFSQLEENYSNQIRNKLNMSNKDFLLTFNIHENRNMYIESRLKKIYNNDDYYYMKHNNPYIRHIIRRKRNFLEDTINPKTGLPYLERIDVKLFGEEKEDAIKTTFYIEDAFEKAEEFAKNYPKKGSGFIKTLLLRRLSSSVKSGLETANRMLESWNDSIFDEDSLEDLLDDDNKIISTKDLEKYRPSEIQRQILKEFISILESNNEYDPKYDKALSLLLEGVDLDNTEPWINRGCILFSQYYDTVKWFAHRLSLDIPTETIGVYSSDDKSGIFIDGVWTKTSREHIKNLVSTEKLRVLVGTDSASEGLNLQTLGSLINIDLPWNPTKLEQRKGRIQRPGQKYDSIYIYNMRYRGSVEDNVHNKLSERLKNIHSMFGEIPSVLKTLWITYALDGVEEANKKIEKAESDYHPFELKYEREIPYIDWSSTEKIVNNKEIYKYLSNSWNE